MKYDIEKFQVKQEYLGGFNGEKRASRKYKYTLTYKDSEFFKDELFSELHTPKINEFEWGEGKSTYYFDDESPTFDNLIDCIKSKYDCITQTT